MQTIAQESNALGTIVQSVFPERAAHFAEFAATPGTLVDRLACGGHSGWIILTVGYLTGVKSPEEAAALASGDPAELVARLPPYRSEGARNLYYHFLSGLSLSGDDTAQCRRALGISLPAVDPVGGLHCIRAALLPDSTRPTLQTFLQNSRSPSFHVECADLRVSRGAMDRTFRLSPEQTVFLLVMSVDIHNGATEIWRFNQARLQHAVGAVVSTYQAHVDEATSFELNFRQIVRQPFTAQALDRFQAVAAKASAAGGDVLVLTPDEHFDALTLMTYPRLIETFFKWTIPPLSGIRLLAYFERNANPDEASYLVEAAFVQGRYGTTELQSCLPQVARIARRFANSMELVPPAVIVVSGKDLRTELESGVHQHAGLMIPKILNASEIAAVDAVAFVKGLGDGAHVQEHWMGYFTGDPGTRRMGELLSAMATDKDLRGALELSPTLRGTNHEKTYLELTKGVGTASELSAVEVARFAAGRWRPDQVVAIELFILQYALKRETLEPDVARAFGHISETILAPRSKEQAYLRREAVDELVEKFGDGVVFEPNGCLNPVVLVRPYRGAFACGEEEERGDRVTFYDYLKQVHARYLTASAGLDPAERHPILGRLLDRAIDFALETLMLPEGKILRMALGGSLEGIDGPHHVKKEIPDLAREVVKRRAVGIADRFEFVGNFPEVELADATALILLASTRTEEALDEAREEALSGALRFVLDQTVDDPELLMKALGLASMPEAFKAWWEKKGIGSSPSEVVLFWCSAKGDLYVPFLEKYFERTLGFPKAVWERLCKDKNPLLWSLVSRHGGKLAHGVPTEVRETLRSVLYAHVRGSSGAHGLGRANSLLTDGNWTNAITALTGPEEASAEA